MIFLVKFDEKMNCFLFSSSGDSDFCENGFLRPSPEISKSLSLPDLQKFDVYIDSPTPEGPFNPKFSSTPNPKPKTKGKNCLTGRSVSFSNINDTFRMLLPLFDKENLYEYDSFQIPGEQFYDPANRIYFQDVVDSLEFYRLKLKSPPGETDYFADSEDEDNIKDKIRKKKLQKRKIVIRV